MAIARESSESHPVPKSVILRGRRKAARHQRGLLTSYREKVQSVSSAERTVMLEEGVPAAQVLRLMKALRLSRPDMGAVTGLTAEQFDQRLVADKSFDGAAGRALFGILSLIEAAESICGRSMVEAFSPSPELLVGKWVGDQVRSDSGEQVHARLESVPELANFTARFIKESSSRMPRNVG